VTTAQTIPTGAILLAGSWRNTNPVPKLIRQVVFSGSGENCTLRVSGTGAFGPTEWGEAPAFPFTEGPGSVEAAAFTTELRQGRFSSVIQAYVVKGVLVMISMSRFDDGVLERSIFFKEFFYRESSR
jgi:hypothetical protein